MSARPPLQSASQAPPWSPVSEMPASGNVAPANPDLACFGAGPSAHKRTPVAGVDGRASDPPRRAFVRRLETVMWREDAVHVEALAGGDGRRRSRKPSRCQTSRRRARATTSSERASSAVRSPAHSNPSAAIGPALPPPRRAGIRRSIEDGGEAKDRRAGRGRGAVERGRRRRASEHRARCAVPLIRTRPWGEVT